MGPLNPTPPLHPGLQRTLMPSGYNIVALLLSIVAVGLTGQRNPPP